MHIRIRPLEENDAYTSYKWRNDPEVFKYTGNTYKHEITLESELNWIRRVITNQNEFRCAIIVDDVYVGNVYLTDIADGKAWFHIFIGDRRYWGKGVARIATQLILEYGKANLALKTIQLSAHPDNLSAINLYSRLGFHKTEVKNSRQTMTLIL